jgi:hypothetical protein
VAEIVECTAGWYKGRSDEKGGVFALALAPDLALGDLDGPFDFGVRRWGLLGRGQGRRGSEEVLRDGGHGGSLVLRA